MVKVQMPNQKHEWLLDVFADLHVYLTENGLEGAAAELRILQFALERELNGNIVRFPKLRSAGPR